MRMQTGAIAKAQIEGCVAASADRYIDLVNY